MTQKQPLLKRTKTCILITKFWRGKCTNLGSIKTAAAIR